MSKLTANSAASLSLSPRTAEAVNSSRMTRDFGGRWPPSCSGLSRSSASVVTADFCSQNTDENFGPVCVCRYVSRLLLGHCFGAFPAPGGTAPLCFGYAALRVMVPP
jgi:hypothetical protein